MLTTDAIVGGVHFFPDDPADAIARKALRVNLSDLAAKGAEPAGFLLALALPTDVERRLARSPSRAALARMPSAYGCPLLGGDTVRTPGPVDGLDHGVRLRAAGHDGAALRREAGRASS